jgi:hypothetical protein
VREFLHHLTNKMKGGVRQRINEMDKMELDEGRQEFIALSEDKLSAMQFS